MSEAKGFTDQQSRPRQGKQEAVSSITPSSEQKDDCGLNRRLMYADQEVAPFVETRFQSKCGTPFLVMDKMNCFTMIVLFLLHVFMWNNKYGALAAQGCGSMVNNTIKSPGYPNDYPRNMHCVYSLPIPYGMAIEIVFADFDVEDDESCGYDYLSISNENKQTFGVYCGKKTGQIVSLHVTGDDAVITFHSDGSVQKSGFLLFSLLLQSVRGGPER
ncbi:Bone morphogenetic protein 1 [Desmophyllum pertusum]|uniref:Bone morphogenetic protein 1 n=1 Tax=Desmophyllum pertusum TaxID=174260 RepID=A0A9W9ZV20_9CNID|nr:Bone morphogenetic protein 1 [Desmophyllum pertusum]